MKNDYYKLVFLLPLMLFTSCSNESSQNSNIKNAIIKTNDFLNYNEMDNALFGNILQAKLTDSLVYNIGSDEYLIYYNDSYYNYKNKSLREADGSNYTLVESFDDINNFSNIILTKGYYSAYDGGNGIYSFDTDLKLLSYNNTINLLQMGYRSGENIDKYVNDFTSSAYTNFFLPKGNYLVKDNFDLTVSNKGYYAFEATIYSDDTYKPTGSNNGCLFNVYNNVSNININGFTVKPRVNEKLDDPLLGLLVLRDATDITIKKCNFYLGHEASIYKTSGMIDLFTNWKNIVIKGCKLENYSSTKAGGGIGIRDIYKKGCENAVIENNYIYSNCKDEVIAIFSGADTSLYPNDTGGGSIKDVTFKNNKIIGGKPDEILGPRVVGLTVGYQISPVSNINYLNNEIEMYAANYLFLYGYASNVRFSNNSVRVDSSYQDNLFIFFSHNSYAKEAEDITIDNNNFTATSNSSIFTLVEAKNELVFKNNDVKLNKITRVFDSISLFSNNNILVDEVTKCVYHNISTVKNNTIKAKHITVIYEFYNINALSDIIISNDTIDVDTISAHMLMFNGNISFNGYSLTFDNFMLNVKNIEAKYYYIAYDTSSIKDSVKISFINSDLSVYSNDGRNYIAKDNDNKVTIIYK